MAISPWSIIASVLLQNLEGISMKQLLKEVDWLKRQASNLGAYIDWPGRSGADPGFLERGFIYIYIWCGGQFSDFISFFLNIP